MFHGFDLDDGQKGGEEEDGRKRCEIFWMLGGFEVSCGVILKVFGVIHLESKE